MVSVTVGNYVLMKYSYPKANYFCQTFNLHWAFRLNHSLQKVQGIEEHVKCHHNEGIQKTKMGLSIRQQAWSFQIVNIIF